MYTANAHLAEHNVVCTKHCRIGKLEEGECHDRLIDNHFVVRVYCAVFCFALAIFTKGHQGFSTIGIQYGYRPTSGSGGVYRYGLKHMRPSVICNGDYCDFIY